VLSTIARMLIFVTFWRSSPHPRSRPTSPAVGPDTPSFRNASATESPSQGSRLDVMSSPIVFSGFEIIPPRIGGLDELLLFLYSSLKCPCTICCSHAAGVILQPSEHQPKPSASGYAEGRCCRPLLAPIINSFLTSDRCQHALCDRQPAG
jgi:hypothetical protein